ncbi:hypothetical protein QQS21_006336 [Conoideocrella luteorostrata]|uniref:Zn(2)-C6 fungal-type domain-containing protein n=1 Tax=Conoideocrella luteorostrata TaxID=1105319 RepID=A0AAJ0FT10_9HYPO|nr:hypothetical protein QQS21_006336 [Conoideocrella luteorostrata]
MPRRRGAVRGSDTGPDNATSQAERQVAVKPRRSHRKSRNGCAECRRRHIRCDKHQPVCSNCTTAERSCFYPDAPRNTGRTSSSVVGGEGDLAHQDGQHQEEQEQEQEAHTETHGTLPVPPSFPSSFPLPTRDESLNTHHLGVEPPPVSVEPSFSTTDLILFHHAETDMDHAGIGPQGQLQQVLSIAVRHSLDAPYLLDQVLALAAVHLSMHLPSTSSPSINGQTSAEASPTSLISNLTRFGLRDHATVLQNRAMASFNQLTSDTIHSDNPDAAVPRFLFSSFLSLHALAETLSVLRTEDLHLHRFIDSFVDCLNLHRGIRAATGEPLYKLLSQSNELRSMLETLNITSEANRNKSPQGTECDPIKTVLDSEDLSTASLRAYRATVDSLQQSFDMYSGLSVQHAPHAASAFSVTAPAEYADLLRKCSPEALVILAYYGVLLHRCRQYWMFRDVGARMVLCIANTLGTYWQDALAWPLQVVETEND